MVSVGFGNIEQLRGMPDVDFDFGVSSALRQAFTRAASALAGQRGPRAGYRTAGGEDFRGHFSQVFGSNGVTQLADLDEIVSNLRLVDTRVADLERAAREENNRRRQAREWAQRMANRNGFEQWWDGLFGGEQPPKVDLRDGGPAASVSSSPGGGRQTPVSGSGGGGTSSARPEALRGFVANTRGADDVLAADPGLLAEHCGAFASKCRWARLDASSVVAAFRLWLSANGQDAAWAQTVAAAFERAGSQGGISTLPNSALTASLANRGIAMDRTDIQIDPPVAFGSPPTTGYADDPVNTATGNFIENETDLGFPGLAASLGFTRCYSSMDEGVGGFGPGWSSWTECGLELTDDSARVRLPDGRVVVFPRMGEGWDRARGENLWFGADGDVFVMTSAVGMRWAFDRAGKPVSTSAGDGTKVSFEFDQAGRLVGMRHEFGRSLELDWDQDRVARIVADDGRTVCYAYDDAGRLIRAASGSQARVYGWNDASLIESVGDADGIVEAVNTYDEQARVATQRSSFGRLTRFSYLPGGVTVAAGQDNAEANTWITDARGRLVGVIDADDCRQSTGYDRWGNPVMVTGRDGTVMLTEYDEWGRRVGQVLPSGVRLAWEYDALGRVVLARVVNDDAVAETSFSYDGAGRNPCRAVDPMGGVTGMVWERGLLKRIVDPTGVALDFAHDGLGDLVAVTDGMGNTSRLERDTQGRVVAVVTPLGFRTRYLYADGLLCERVDPDGARWRYEHTAAGRLCGVMDPLGGRTSIEFGDHGGPERVADELGRVAISGYDDLGNLTSVELPDGSRWDLAFDASSRLVGATDPSGGRFGCEMDVNGDVVSATDPTGVTRRARREVAGLPTAVVDGGDDLSASYDQLGRVVSVAGPDGASRLYRYDLCGRLVEVVDPAGAVTSLLRDAAGRIVQVRRPLGDVFGYEYDMCGRWAATISTGGHRYEVTYDADGRIVVETWPTGERVTTVHDECGRIVERTEPGRGRMRFGYDKLGRIVWVRDGWLGTRRFHYDAAGQLVAAVNALGGVTRYEYDDLGRQVAVTDPLGGRTIRSFDAMGRLLSITDPLGRVAQHSYDEAGRLVAVTDPDGGRACWRYDTSGRLMETLEGDRVQSRIVRDFAGRRIQVVEPGMTHELVWDAAGRLVSRLRDGQGVLFGYDQDGRRVSLTRPDGSQVTCEYDPDHRMSAVSDPGVGRIAFDRDEIGRVVGVHADGLSVEMEYRDGFLAGRRTNRRGFISQARWERDVDGRVVAQTMDGLATRFSYDEAGQLTGTVSLEGSWSRLGWDANGRLVSEETNTGSVHHSYDVAGQLTDTDTGTGRVLFGYDGAGRRTKEVHDDGSERHYGWDFLGRLTRVTDVSPGQDQRETIGRDVLVDALGEVAAVDGQPLWWDTVSGSLLQAGPAAVVNAGGHGTAVIAEGGVSWSLPDTETARQVWAPPGTSAGGPPAGLTVSASGQIELGGLSWLGARVYDLQARSFLSTDPLAPVTGAGWAGNPYSFAGNDPVNLSDPSGLRPVTDAELQAYRDGNQGSLAAAASAVSGWVGDNWEYIAAGALIVGGIAVMATGVGGPIGAAMIAGALVGAGGSVWSQKSSTGTVDWGRVAVDGAVGAATGLIGGGAAAGAVRATSQMTNCLGRNLISGAAAGVVDGGASGALTYLASGEPVTVQGLASATAVGAGTGLVLGTAGGGLAHVSGVARYACFTPDTKVLMADGTTKPIQDIKPGDEVLAYNPETGENEPGTVAKTHTHHNSPTLRVTTTDGEIVSTATHLFYVLGKGWTPAGELTAGDFLHNHYDGRVQVLLTKATRKHETVHNLTVEGLHNYWTLTSGDCTLLVHNDCTWEHNAGRWRDLDTGRFVQRPTDPLELLHNGRVKYNDIDQWATQGNLPNEWFSSPDRFPTGGFRYIVDNKPQVWGHGVDQMAAVKNPHYAGGQYPTASFWGEPRHVPLDGSPF